MKILKDFDHKVKVFLRSVDVNECLASNLSPPANFLSCKYFDSLLINFVVESYVNLALSAKIIVIINWSENARTLLIEEFLVNKANKNYVIFEATQTINQHFWDNNMLFKFWCLHFHSEQFCKTTFVFKNKVYKNIRLQSPNSLEQVKNKHFVAGIVKFVNFLRTFA